MNIKEAIENRRTIRKFEQKNIDENILKELVKYGSLCASGGNIQPLKYKIINEKKLLNEIFPDIKWAAYLNDGSPSISERPVAYIAVLGDTELKKSFETDAGAAITNIILGALDYGIASCWLGAINRKNIIEKLNVSDRFELIYLVALGYPAQKSSICEFENSVKYYLDNEGNIVVPKRSIDRILL